MRRSKESCPGHENITFVEIWSFLARTSVVKTVFLVDTIIELCVKMIRRGLGGSVLEPFSDTTSFVLLFIQTLFMVSQSGTTLKVLFYRDIQMFLLKFLLVLGVSDR